MFLFQDLDLFLELIDHLLLLKQLDVAIDLPWFERADILAILHLVFEVHAHFVESNLNTLSQYLNFSPLLLIGRSLLSQILLSTQTAFLIILNKGFDLILSQQSLTKLTVPFLNPG